MCGSYNEFICDPEMQQLEMTTKKKNGSPSTMSDAYLPGALTTFLSSTGHSDTKDTLKSKKSRKRRTKNVSAVQGPPSGAESLFEKSASNIKVPEMHTGVAVIEPKRNKVEGKTNEESEKRKIFSRERQRLNGMKKEEMTTAEKACTVFVGNTPISASRKTIRKLFSKYGPIETVRLRSVISGNEKTSKKLAVIKQDFSSKMHSLHFYIKFANADSANAALAMNGEQLDGHRLRVDSCNAKKNYDSQTTVFIGNVPFDAQEDNLYTHFEKCGDVNLVRIVRDRNTGIGKGFAFVSFKDSAAVPIALKMDGSSFEGRQLRVTRIQKKNKRVVGSEAIRNNTKKAKRRIVNEQKLSKFMTNNRKALFEKEGNSSTLKKSIRKKIKKRQRKANSKSVIS
ncbi:RNA-binding protein 34 [Toxocara canis]|uniref:RNA-binding protein 34 n=1 Tax=Toxocara canis TaxID=6265 RepID=A0A0B2UR20_TOXCA|nr:RNA-binding protein 34 [Toxocara canis]